MAKEYLPGQGLTPRPPALKKVVKKPVGRPTSKKTEDYQEKGEQRRNAATRYQKKIDAAARNIRTEQWLELIDNINWDRRLSMKKDLQSFCRTYLGGTFYMNWSEDQVRCCKKSESCWMSTEMFALAMPRGGGKTAVTRGSVVWGTAYGHKRFPCNVSASDPKSLQTLDAVKTFWYGSPLLLQDFPEIAWPIRKLENRSAGARGQTFDGFNTHVIWGSKAVRYPCLLLPKKDARVLLDNDPDCLTEVNVYNEETGVYEQRWTPVSSGINISTYGIGGAIRGEAQTHPILLEQPRPDLVILDDVQKDIVAESPLQVDKLVMLIEGAVGGLAGPGSHVSVIMPCTVTREGDASDTFLDINKKPEYRGERCKLVSSWPEGITDLEISMETEPGILWNKYREVQKQSYRDFDTHSKRCEKCRDDLLNPCRTGKKIKASATRLYKENREVMDKDFHVTWKERYGNPVLRTVNGKKKLVRLDTNEISAQQHAMNLRFKSEETFPAEYQNRGRKLNDEGEILISSSELQKKTVDYRRGEMSPETQYIGAFVDVQMEGLFYAVGAAEPDFTGAFIDYGSFPDMPIRYFSKLQMNGWGYLTKIFFERYPEQRAKATRTEAGKYQADLNAKIYHALSVFIPQLLQRMYTKRDEYGTRLGIQKLAIDTRWGLAADTIKRYIRECGHKEVVPYHGQSISAANRQLEEYELRKGWFFEHQKHRGVRNPMWVLRPNPDGMTHMMADVDRAKDFLFSRLAAPVGSSGSFSLYNDVPENHEMFCDHICKSEYPEVVYMRGLKKNKWIERQVAFDNDYLDCGAGVMCILSYLGACLVTGGESASPKKSITDVWNTRRKR